MTRTNGNIGIELAVATDNPVKGSFLGAVELKYLLLFKLDTIELLAQTNSPGYCS